MQTGAKETRRIKQRKEEKPRTTSTMHSHTPNVEQQHTPNALTPNTLARMERNRKKKTERGIRRKTPEEEKKHRYLATYGTVKRKANHRKKAQKQRNSCITPLCKKSR